MACTCNTREHVFRPLRVIRAGMSEVAAHTRAHDLSALSMVQEEAEAQLSPQPVCGKCEEPCARCEDAHPYQCISCDQDCVHCSMREQQCITCEKDCVYCDGSSNACPQCGMDCPRCESVRECPNCEKECVYCNDVDDGICTSCKRECFFCKNALDNNGGGCEICRMWCVPTDDGPSTCLCTMRRCGACNTVFHLQDKQLCDAECICSAVFCPACITRNIYVGRRFADGASGDRSAAQDRRWRGPVLECSLCTTVRNRRITTDEQLLEAACKRLRVTRAELAQLSLDDQLPHDPITKQRQRERARRRAAKRKLDARS